MPIRKEMRDRYPLNWKARRRGILIEAEWRCECTGQCGLHRGRRCTELHGKKAAYAAGKVVLTIAHLDHVPEHCDRANIKAMCQRCHLVYDRDHHAETRAASAKADGRTG